MDKRTKMTTAAVADNSLIVLQATNPTKDEVRQAIRNRIAYIESVFENYDTPEFLRKQQTQDDEILQKLNALLKDPPTWTVGTSLEVWWQKSPEWRLKILAAGDDKEAQERLLWG